MALVKGIHLIILLWAWFIPSMVFIFRRGELCGLKDIAHSCSLVHEWSSPQTEIIMLSYYVSVFHLECQLTMFYVYNVLGEINGKHK